MTQLISDAQFALIRTTFNDVIETFMNLDVQYDRTISKLSRFKEDRDDNVIATHTIKGLYVPVATDTDSQFDKTRKGDFNMSESVVYFGYDDLLALGLIDTTDGGNKTVFKPERDRIRINGIEHEIIGENMLGQWKDNAGVATFVLVKIHMTRILKTNK